MELTVACKPALGIKCISITMDIAVGNLCMLKGEWAHRVSFLKIEGGGGQLEKLVIYLSMFSSQAEF